MDTRLLITSSLTLFAGLVMVQSAIAQTSGTQGGEIAIAPVATAASAAHWSTIHDFDKRHEACLTAIASDADTTYEDALIWKNDGGGWRAGHCVSMALFALGHAEEAAHRLETMGATIGWGTAPMRADRYTESADFWLEAGDTNGAYRAASAALELEPKHLGARLARARAYAQLGRRDHAEIDLTSALVYHPGNPKALRFRADARRGQGKLTAALADIEQALRYDPTSVESALLRGQIREAIRLKALGADSIKTPK